MLLAVPEALIAPRSNSISLCGSDLAKMEI
jgi:hypothetical protein